MVMQIQREGVPTYQLLDERGQPIGSVILPRDSRVIGPGQRTVLLQR